MRGRVVCLILSILSVLIMAGCSKTRTTEEFMDKDWLFYNEVTAEHLCLNLGSDGSYSYHCQCGEPVGNSDVYDQYKDDMEAEIKVLDYNEYHLMIIIDGEIKDFVLQEHDTSSNFYSFEGESYLGGYESRCTVVDIKDGKIVCGPVNYDPEGLYEKGPFEEYELTENMPVFDLTIQRYLSVQDDYEYEESYDVSFTEIGQEEMNYILDSGVGAAFLWFDDELKVEKIVFWGENSVTE